MALTSDEVNYLVFRYLQESGFTHSAFTFSHESQVDKLRIDHSDVPLGALVTYLQKGLQYHAIETHMRDDGSRIVGCTEPFTLLARHVCSPSATTVAAAAAAVSVSAAAVPQPPQPPTTTTTKSPTSQPQIQPSQAAAVKVEVEREATGRTLQGHTAEVFTCAWNPQRSETLASGSGDATARVWNAAAGTQLRELRHADSDVTTIDWNGDGTQLATGSYDGLARVWALGDGRLLQTLRGHQGPIFSLRWNPRGDRLLSGSVDKTAIVWDVARGEMQQQFCFHTLPTLDVDWRDDTSFATCSTDKTVLVCALGSSRPLRRFLGHADEVNAIKWDPTGTLLASCSDDTTARIWRMGGSDAAASEGTGGDAAMEAADSIRKYCAHCLNGHAKEIYTIKWSPAPNAPRGAPPADLTLATASFDATVRVWDAETGSCLHTLARHTEAVYSVAYSHSGEFIASGSFDNCVHIWAARTGELVRTFRGTGGIFDVSWNATDTMVAAGAANHDICIIDLRK